jgi:hypothetical protein
MKKAPKSTPKPKRSRSRAVSPQGVVESEGQVMVRLAAEAAIAREQVNAARQLFYRLVELRVADRLKFGDLQLNDASAYGVNEQLGFEQQLEQAKQNVLQGNS